MMGTILGLWMGSLFFPLWPLDFLVSGPRLFTKEIITGLLVIRVWVGMDVLWQPLRGVGRWGWELFIRLRDWSSCGLLYPTNPGLFPSLWALPYSGTICFTHKLAKLCFHWFFMMVKLIPKLLNSFLRTIEAQNEIHTKEKEKLMDKIQEMQEASEHLRKQFETENEIKSSFRQEASHLTMEKRVRSFLSCW